MRNPSRQDTGSRKLALLFGGAIAAMIAVRLVASGLVLLDCIENPINILGGDARRYLAILESVGVPYRDFEVEYPPLTLAFTQLIQGPDLLATQVRLVVSQLLIELAIAGLLVWGWNRRVSFAYLLLGTPMALYPFPYFRVDLLAALFAVGAMALVKKARPGWGGAVLGLAGFVKVWPLVLAPWLVLRGDWASRAARRSAAAFVAVVVAGGLAWVAWAGIDGPIQVFSFRGANGWQIESVVGIFVHMADPASSAVEQGAWRTAAEVPRALRIALPVLGLGTAAAAWALAERARRDERPATDVGANGADEADEGGAGVVLDGWAPLAAVLGLIVFSSIISPQYVVWLTPFAAVVAASRARGRLLVGGLFLAIGALSGLGLALLHSLKLGGMWSMGVVALRNGLLVVLLVTCFVALVRRPRRQRAGASALDAHADHPNGDGDGVDAADDDAQATPKARIATMNDTDATRSIDGVSSGMP